MQVTLSEALSICDGHARCRGITYSGSNTTKAKQHVYFKMDAGVAHSHGWSSWLKQAPVTPPALTVSVGGTSRLELRLRQDFFTVQNLSRSGEKWSFTRPLDDSSTLPFCAHLGDLTLRLRPVVGEHAANATSNWSLISTISNGAPASPLPLDASSIATSSGGRGQLLAAHDITPVLAASVAPGGGKLPLIATRRYERSSDGAALLIKFNLTSTASAPIELGAIGMALPESPGHPPAGIESVVWADPHIGGGGGFVEFVRVVDDEATLLVTPLDPGSSPLEAWRPMLEDLGKGDAYEWVSASKAWAEEWATNRQAPFLNMSDALMHTYPPFASAPTTTPWPSTDGRKPMPILAQSADAAHGGNGAANPWNAPTSRVLKPGESLQVGLRLQLAAHGPRTRDAALSAMGSPVLRGVPGYVLPTDLGEGGASLLIRPPPGTSVASVSADPTPSGVTASLTFRLATGKDGAAAAAAAAASSFQSTSTSSSMADGGGVNVDGGPGGFVRYLVTPSGYGRVRARITFSDGSSATAHYFVTPPFSSQVAALGRHLADTAWLPREYPDPFGRGASVMPWDRSRSCGAGGADVCGHVLNDARAYDVGLSDDAGGGNPLGFASKVRAMPTAHEASRIDEYIQYTLYGVKPGLAKPPLKSLQIREDEIPPNATQAEKESVDGIRMTLFYYAPDLGDNSSGHWPYNYTEADKCHKPFGGPTWCMTENMANATYRGFNYPHQIASYWSMYTVARFTSLPTRMPWHWYLYRAAKTSLKLGRASVGFMDGTVAREVLDALLIEGAAGNATLAALGATLKANMHARQLSFASVPYPYGSEFGFDTTGQEEVVVWNLYFGNESVAKKTVDHVLSYMRSSPTWAYHGGARSWGDIGNNGKYLATFGTGASDRGQMHYRSGLNMIPLIEWYRRHPEEGTFLLEIAMGAISGQMTNIDPKTGEGSMMFHAAPHVLTHDPHSGDFGLGMFGNALESGSYLVNDPALGGEPLCFLCELGAATRDGRAAGGGGEGQQQQQEEEEEEAAGPAMRTVTPRDAYRIAVFIEPLGLYLTSQCGTFASLAVPAEALGGGSGKPPVGARAKPSALAVTFAPSPHCPRLRLVLTKTAKARPGSGFAVEGCSARARCV